MRFHLQGRDAGKPRMTWHILDAVSPSVKEFASCLSRVVPTRVWTPHMEWNAYFARQGKMNLAEPPLELDVFPLQRGYSRRVIGVLSRTNSRLLARLLRSSSDAERSPLICTSPFYAAIAERWPGPVIYYQTDLVAAYEGVNAAEVRSLDRRLCRTSAAVCVNSQRIANYMARDAGCFLDKITVVQNATRAANVPGCVSIAPAALPPDLSGLRRPIVGVIGNMAANVDWCLLENAIARATAFSWAFIGPTEMHIRDAAQSQSRQRLMSGQPRVHFAGIKPYSALQSYARAFDVALMPYRRAEPTFSGSPTRFFEHLAAGRPIVSTRGVEQLLSQEHLLHFVDTAAELVQTLESLRGKGFQDGKEVARWQASKQGTWENRAEAVIATVKPDLDFHDLHPEPGRSFWNPLRPEMLERASPARINPCLDSLGTIRKTLH
ncbi:MAG: glycosyltransferase [Acidobacteriota bacterium]|nr:glycosyltransferase [Acidobacteriota bacterium]